MVELRIMRRVYPERKVSGVTIEETEEYGLYEVYYDDSMKPHGWSQEPQPVTCQDMEGIHWTLEKFDEAISKPVLDYETGEEVDSRYKRPVPKSGA